MFTAEWGQMVSIVDFISNCAPTPILTVIVLIIFSLSTAHDHSSLVLSKHSHPRTSVGRLGLHGWQLLSPKSSDLHFLLRNDDGRSSSLFSALSLQSFTPRRGGGQLYKCALPMASTLPHSFVYG